VGGSGDDVLTGGAGEDELDGGEGMDTASYADSDDGVMVNLMTGMGEDGDADGDMLSNIENVRGSMGDDTLKGDGMGNVLYGQMGDDDLQGMGGNDTLRGGMGDDALDGGMGDDLLKGEKGDDVLFGGEGMDTFYFLDGHGENEITDFTKGDDTIKFSADPLSPAAAEAILDTETATTRAGKTTYTYTHGETTVKTDVQLEISDLHAVQPPAPPDPPEPPGPPTRPTPARVPYTLTDGNDTWPSERAQHNDGDERINAGKGNDTVYGGDGDDLLYGEDGSDSLMGEDGHDDLFGGKGNDKLEGGDGGDILKGEAGNDMLYGGIDTRGPDGTAGNADDLTDPDMRYADTLEGGAGMDTMHGGAGDDMIIADFADLGDIAAADLAARLLSLNFPATGEVVPASITGGPGMDTISFEGEKDYPVGSAAANTPGTTGGVSINLYDATQSIEHFTGSERPDIVTQINQHGTAGTPAAPLTLEQYGGSEVRLGGGNDMFTGGTGVVDHDGVATTPTVGRNDMVYGGEGKDTLDGGAGDDMIEGGVGNDSLTGGAGKDTIMGGAGDDTINGGSDGTLEIADPTTYAADVLTGGGGEDTFIWGHKDTITDFQVHGDADIDLGITGTDPQDRPHDFVELSRTADGKLQVTIDASVTGRAGETMYFEGIALPSTQAARDLLIDDMFDL
jgi:Ca2+-binding RTX toxin-like protein